MKILVDILIIIFIVLGTVIGVKKGLLKSLVGLIGLTAIVIISYTLRAPLANFLIDKMPFFNFSGVFAGLTSLNILIYNIVAFVVLFVVLYCILNIIISLTGFIDTLLKFTVIWVIPSKIGGALLGFLEAWIFVFLVLFVLVQFNITNNFVTGSKTANFVLEHTPVIGKYLSGAKNAAGNIYELVEKYSEEGIESVDNLNRDILGIEVANGLISKDKANELIQTGKIQLEGVMFGKGTQKWSNI